MTTKFEATFVRDDQRNNGRIWRPLEAQNIGAAIKEVDNAATRNSIHGEYMIALVKSDRVIASRRTNERKWLKH